MNIRKIYFIIFSIILFLSSCGELIKRTTPTKKETSWVYIELETIMKKDTTLSYLYGKINKSILDNLETKNINDIFKVSEIRYFNDNDKFQLYKDDDESGTLFFSVQSIKKISVYERDPIYSFDKEDLHLSTLELLK
ncbi:hypothetical protein BW723_13435 [Polaribacter reichenbachii]|uniref:Lipoprotein n=1 Tax=Polaribacter reichenbachii TaxID=996801 RepID=A0A1B8U195_9FLAO|nr:hypothetical protein [Polaribacter reichenbachii]APZ47223.1 hypothetical protein BW723_13435 [Polaribacter reichenbachii]AUC17864.1 hypothetical protein BTO17_03890 [Polaribacter reichenbachii]OBY65645.1 hypothetical protein LPB301_08345 [Polaribacter reichenbachii]